MQLQRGGHCPALTGTSHLRVMGKTPNQFRHGGEKDSILTTLYSIMTTGQISSSHNSTLFSSDMARNVFCLLISGLREVKELHMSDRILLGKKISNNLIITVTWSTKKKVLFNIKILLPHWFFFWATSFLIELLVQKIIYKTMRFLSTNRFHSQTGASMKAWNNTRANRYNCISMDTDF